MSKFKVFLSVKREKEDKLVFENDEEKFAVGFIKNVTRYLEPFEEGFHEDEDRGRYYVQDGKETTYHSRWYEIPR